MFMMSKSHEKAQITELCDLSALYGLILNVIQPG